MSSTKIARDQTLVKHAAYEQRTTRFYNSRVTSQAFLQGNLVLKKLLDPKLQPMWEGPYRISAILAFASYRLTNMKGRELSHT